MGRSPGFSRSRPKPSTLTRNASRFPRPGSRRLTAVTRSEMPRIPPGQEDRRRPFSTTPDTWPRVVRPRKSRFTLAQHVAEQILGACSLRVITWPKVRDSWNGIRRLHSALQNAAPNASPYSCRGNVRLVSAIAPEVWRTGTWLPGGATVTIPGTPVVRLSHAGRRSGALCDVFDQRQDGDPQYRT